MRNACSGRPGDRVTPADGELLVPEETRSLAVENDEEFFLGRVAMRRTVELSRSGDRVVESCPNRARGPPELPKRVADLSPLLLLRLDVVDVDDPRRSRARRRKIRVAEPRLERPLVTPVHVEPVRPRHERVRLLASEMDEAVASAHLVGHVRLPLPLPREPRPAKDVEDLL